MKHAYKLCNYNFFLQHHYQQKFGTSSRPIHFLPLKSIRLSSDAQNQFTSHTPSNITDAIHDKLKWYQVVTHV